MGYRCINMDYNVLPGAVWSVNTTEGNKAVSYYDLYRLSEFNDLPILTVSGADVLVLDFDLGHRLHLDRFEYKFISPTPITSGIQFFYKNENFESYVSLVTMSDTANLYFATTSGEIFAPRYLRLKHTATISGSLCGVRASNNDTVVDFGITGTLASGTVEAARGGDEVITTVPIYNDSPNMVNAYVSIESDTPEIYNITSISTNTEGPWLSHLDTSNMLLDWTNYPTGGYGGTSGSDIHYYNDTLRMAGVDVGSALSYVSIFDTGIYTTRVFSGGLTYCKLLLNKLVGYNGHIAVTAGDPSDTIEVRSHNQPPAPYAFFREVLSGWVRTNVYAAVYRDRWFYSRVIKETSSVLDNDETYKTITDSVVRVDSLEERWSGYYRWGNVWSNYYGKIFVFSGTLSTYNSVEISVSTVYDTAPTIIWYDHKMVSGGGFWTYFFGAAGNTSYLVDTTGYYLIFFDPSLNILFKWFDINKNIGVIDVDYSERYIWYTLPGTGTITKVTSTGEVLLTVTDESITDDLGGIAVLPDKGILLTNGKNLHRLKYNGLHLSEYDLVDVFSENISYMVLDGDGSEAVWVIEGMYVGRFYVTGPYAGTYDFKVEVVFPVRLIPIGTGVCVYCVDVGDTSSGSKMAYISKDNKRVEFYHTPDLSAGGSCPGVMFQDHTDLRYSAKMPVGTETNWQTLPWNKVSTDGFLFSEDQYFQLRITFRAQTLIERYPDLITDSNEVYMTQDYFDQTDTKPKEQFWSDWKNRPALDRVYVDTSTKELVMVPDWSTSVNAYITTKNRVVFGRDSNGVLDIIIYYKYKDNGTASGRTELFYLNGYCVDAGREDRWIKFYWTIPPNPVSTYSRGYQSSSTNTTWYNIGMYNKLGLYDSAFRIYMTSTYHRVYWLSGGAWGFQEIASYIGDLFYFDLIQSAQSTTLRIKDFRLNAGYAYSYKDTQRITTIAKQNALEVSNIYPYNYKNVYVKTQVPSSSSIISNCDFDLNVNWRLPS